jgi:hypothetical protein
MAINGDDHRQTNRGLGSGDRDGEDGEHHAGWLVRLRSETPECDEIQIRRGQHQLNTDEDKNRVTSTKRSEEASGKYRGRNDNEGLKCRCHGLAKVTKVKKVTLVKKGNDGWANLTL